MNGGKVNKIDIYRQKYLLDVNCLYNSNSIRGDSEGLGTFDVYVDGKIRLKNVSDGYLAFRVGETYEIKNVQAKQGYKYTGIAKKEEIYNLESGYFRPPFETAIGIMNAQYIHNTDFKGRSLFLKFELN